MYQLVGNCINDFDEDGQGSDAIPYRDATELAQSVERAVVVPEAKKPDSIFMLPTDVLLYDEVLDVYLVHNVDEDIHFIHIKM